MPSIDMLIGVNMARAAGDANMRDANATIHEIADQRDQAWEENRRLATKLRQMEDRLADRRFKQNLEAMRTKELAAEVKRFDPQSPIVGPTARAESRRRAARELLSDPSYGFQGYVYDDQADELKRG